jgi:hypothetical protein
MVALRLQGLGAVRAAGTAARPAFTAPAAAGSSPPSPRPSGAP